MTDNQKPEPLSERQPDVNDAIIWLQEFADESPAESWPERRALVAIAALRELQQRRAAPEPRTADMPPGLFDAPCLWCAYNGAGYWMAGTHDLNCPWFRIGGHNERRMALADVIRKQAKSDHDEPSPDPIDPTLGPELGLGHSGRFIQARKPAPAQGQAALVREKLRSLVIKWRDMAVGRDHVGDHRQAETFDQCADELAEALDALKEPSNGR